MRRYGNFVNSPYGVLEYRICKLLGKTPKEIGKIRRDNPKQIRFFEIYIEEEAKAREEQREKARRKGN